MQIDFYILENSDWQSAALYACKIIAKAYTQGASVFVYTRTATEAAEFDQLLWTYKEDSFLPHALTSTQLQTPPPIQIGFEPKANPSSDIILNLGGEVLDFFATAKRLLEIVFTDASVQANARERFRHYRSLGHTLNTHSIKAS